MEQKDSKNNLFLLTIVAIVAIVATMILVSPSGSKSYLSEDTAGQAARVATAGIDTEGKMGTDTSSKSIIDPTAICNNGQTQSCNTGLLGICAVGTKTCSNGQWGACIQNQNATIDICGNGIDEDCNGADLQCTNSITRSFSSNPALRNTTINVTITKNIQPNQYVLIVEEHVPPGFTIINPGTGYPGGVFVDGNSVKWVELPTVGSGTYSYIVRTPYAPGPYLFSGVYSSNGEQPIKQIEGDSSLVVHTTSSCTDADNDGYCADNSQIDCNDNNANIHPWANDVCDGMVDQDCDGYDCLLCHMNLNSLSNYIVHWSQHEVSFDTLNAVIYYWLLGPC